MKFVVLGGTGAMGRVAVRDLHEYAKDSAIVIAARDVEKATAYAKQFNGRVRVEHVDVQNKDELVRVLRDCDVVLNCTNYYQNLEVMEGALTAQTNYLDLGGLFHMTKKQLLLHTRFKSIHKLALLGCGSTPGITNVMAAHGVELFDTVEEIHVSFGSKDLAQQKELFTIPYSLETLFDEFLLEPAVLIKGKLKMVAPMSGAKTITFPSPIGTLTGFYTLHSELATFPESFRKKGLKECSFRVTFDKQFLERIKFLIDLGFASHQEITIGSCSVQPRAFAAKVLNRLVPETVHDIEYVRVELTGTKHKKKKYLTLDCVTKSHSKYGFSAWAYDTGVPISIMAMMLTRQDIRGSGAMAPEHCVPPKIFFRELRKRGIVIQER